MKQNLLFLLPALALMSSCNQKPVDYNSKIAEARDSYQSGKFEDSAEKYEQAFNALEHSDSVSHRYEAARSWGLANDKESAFEQLSWISNEGKYADLGQISSDSAFYALRSDERWMDVLMQVRENEIEAKARLSEVASLLETVRMDDQVHRQELGTIEEKYGPDSDELQAHWELIHKQDSLNLIKVKKVLDEHGWLGWDLIGRSANGALFLVIQHSDIETQLEYLPMLREAVEKGDAAPSELALLEDRVALGQGEKQIYGSQISKNKETGEYYLAPLIDPDNVDKRREEVGLGPIGDYISNWGLTWDPEAYKEMLPELEAMRTK